MATKKRDIKNSIMDALTEMQKPDFVKSRFIEYQHFVLWSTLTKEDKKRYPDLNEDDGEHWEATSLQQFAKAIGVNRSTLCEWRTKKEFWSGLETIQKIRLREGIPDVLNGLSKRAKKQGTAPEVKLYLQVTGYLKEDTDLDIGLTKEAQSQIDKLKGLLPN